MSILYLGDCLEEMKSIEDESVDLIFCDLPYGQTSCKWDCKIDLEKFWVEVMRVKKLNTPIFFTTTTKFGVDLIKSAPKKCPFRYDLVWVKSSPAGFLSAKKMPLRKHELVYVFYEKLPFYDLSSHRHKFIREVPTKRAGKDGVDNKGMIKNRSKSGMEKIGTYDPPLPVSVCNYDVNKNAYGGGKEGRIKISKDKEDHQQKYDPPLPVSVVKEEIEEGQTLGDKGNECYGKFSYYNNGVKGYEPPLPVSVVKEEKTQITKSKEKDLYGDMKGGTIGAVHGVNYDPPLPTTMLEIKSTRGKHSTEKPVALMEWILKYYSKEGDVVLDPTMGSGSTGVACKNMKRNFIGIELDEEIYGWAVNRIED